MTIFIIITSIAFSVVNLIKYKKLKKQYHSLNSSIVELNNKLSLYEALTSNQIKEVINNHHLDNYEQINSFYCNNGYNDQTAYIAHGGGTKEFVYTNSLEAVKDSLYNNFKFIEIDLIETEDHKIIGGHDWEYFKKNTNVKKIDNTPLLYKDVSHLLINNKFSVISGAEISDLLEKNKDWFLVTDKISNYELLLKFIPHPNRMIVEVFSLTDYIKAIKSGIKYPAFCIWDLDSLKVAQQYKFPIVTLAAWNFFDSQEKIDMVKQLHDSGVVIMVFGSGQPYWNDPEWAKNHLGKTFSKMYSDKWSPRELP